MALSPAPLPRRKPRFDVRVGRVQERDRDDVLPAEEEDEAGEGNPREGAGEVEVLDDLGQQFTLIGGTQTLGSGTVTLGVVEDGGLCDAGGGLGDDAEGWGLRAGALRFFDGTRRLFAPVRVGDFAEEGADRRRLGSVRPERLSAERSRPFVVDDRCFRFGSRIESLNGVVGDDTIGDVNTVLVGSRCELACTRSPMITIAAAASPPASNATK